MAAASTSAHSGLDERAIRRHPGHRHAHANQTHRAFSGIAQDREDFSFGEDFSCCADEKSSLGKKYS